MPDEGAGGTVRVKCRRDQAVHEVVVRVVRRDPEAHRLRRLDRALLSVTPHAGDLDASVMRDRVPTDRSPDPTRNAPAAAARNVPPLESRIWNLDDDLPQIVDPVVPSDERRAEVWREKRTFGRVGDSKLLGRLAFSVSAGRSGVTRGAVHTAGVPRPGRRFTHLPRCFEARPLSMPLPDPGKGRNAHNTESGHER